MVSFHRWRCWSASLQCPCPTWCWVSTWATRRVKEMPSWVTSTTPPSPKGRHRPPSPQQFSTCTTSAGMVTTTHRRYVKLSAVTLTPPPHLSLQAFPSSSAVGKPWTSGKPRSGCSSLTSRATFSGISVAGTSWWCACSPTRPSTPRWWARSPGCISAPRKLN